MDLDEALEILKANVSGYFVDDFAVELMREHYLASKSHPFHPTWSAIQSAFVIAMERCSDAELNQFIEREFGIACTLPQDGRELLSYIYGCVFEEQD